MKLMVGVKNLLKYLQFDGERNTKVTISSLAQGFKTIFLDVDKGNELYTMLYDQRNHSNLSNPFGIYNNDSEGDIAYQARNDNGVTYINGVLNKTIMSSELSTRHLITIVNDTVTEDNTELSVLGQTTNPNAGYSTSMKFYKFLGFKEVLSEKQIQMVIKRYNLNV